MGVLIYATTVIGVLQRLMGALEGVVHEEEILICPSVRRLSHMLRRPERPEAAVLLVSTRDELTSLLSICDLFSDIRLIILLPDRAEETISKGHRLYPRYLGYIDSDFSDVAAVLVKMLASERGSKPGEKEGAGRRVIPFCFRHKVSVLK